MIQHLGVITCNGSPQNVGPLVVNRVLRSVAVVAAPANTDSVYVGDSTLNPTTLAGVLNIVPSGEQWSLTGQRDETLSLSSLWVQGTSGDKIVIVGEAL